MALMDRGNDPRLQNRCAVLEPSYSTEAFDSIALSASAEKQGGRSGLSFKALTLLGFGLGLLAATC